METRNVEQKTVLRFLMLMKLLRRNSLTIPEMIERLSYEENGHKIDKQTIYRYHKLIKTFGSTLEQKYNLYITLVLIIFAIIS